MLAWASYDGQLGAIAEVFSRSYESAIIASLEYRKTRCEYLTPGIMSRKGDAIFPRFYYMSKELTPTLIREWHAIRQYAATLMMRERGLA